MNTQKLDRVRPTHICAQSSGDVAFLHWLHSRLCWIYAEDPNTDFVLTTKAFARYFERRARVPRWLNWILERYDL